MIETHTPRSIKAIQINNYISLVISIPALFSLPGSSVKTSAVIVLSFLLLVLNIIGIRKRNALGLFTGLFIGFATLLYSVDIWLHATKYVHMAMESARPQFANIEDPDLIANVELVISKMIYVLATLFACVGGFYIFAFYKNREIFD